MAGANIQLNPRQVRELERILGRNSVGFARAKGTAIKRTLTTVRTRTVRAITSEIAIKQKAIYERNNRRKPIVEKLERHGVGGAVSGARIEITGRRIPLGRFSPKQHWRKGKTQGRVRSAVSYKIEKNGKRKRVKEDLFLVEFASGFKGIMEREGRDRLPLKMKFGPSIPQVAEDSPAMRKLINIDAGAALEKNMGSQIDRFMRKGNGGR